MHEPCKQGHVVGRYASGDCIECGRANAKSYYWRNRDRALIQARRRKEADPDRVRAQAHKAHLKRAFGLTPAEYEKLLAAQDGRCAICATDDSGPRRWHVDHCHETGTIRGILCAQCNVMIAMARDDAATLRSAIEYLEAAGAAH